MHILQFGRSSDKYLAEAFFAIFPNQKLVSKLKLAHSSVIFTWIRLAYGKCQHIMKAALQELKKKLIQFDHNCYLYGKSSEFSVEYGGWDESKILVEMKSRQLLRKVQNMKIS